MKKLITCLTVLSMILASVPAAAVQAEAAEKKAPAAAAETVQAASPADLIGRWFLQEGGESTGYVMVYEDGTYSYYSYAENTAYGGTVTIEYDEHPDGTASEIYSFYDSNGEFWIGAQESSADNRNTLTVGQTGEQILTHAEAVPNDYGFYDAEDVPESGISVTALNGEWINPYVLFGNWESCAVSFLFDSYCPYAGSFTMTVSENDMQDSTAFGSVRLQYQLDGDGSCTYMDIRFERIADAPQAYTYSDDQLMDMALNDYEAKHGIRPDSASVVTVLDGIPVPEDEAVIVLSDENGSDLDYYTVNADTGVGTNSASEPVNLPQTGNNSLKNLLIMAGALLMTVFGVFAVRQSGKLRRREEQ